MTLKVLAAAAAEAKWVEEATSSSRDNRDIDIALAMAKWG